MLSHLPPAGGEIPKNGGLFELGNDVPKVVNDHKHRRDANEPLHDAQRWLNLVYPGDNGLLLGLFMFEGVVQKDLVLLIALQPSAINVKQHCDRHQHSIN